MMDFRTTRNCLALVSVWSVLLPCLYFSVDVSKLQRRIELSTPATSWFRVKECIALIENGINPYEGNTCHQLPLAIALFRTLLGFKDYIVLAFFMVIQIATGLLLAVGAQKFTIEKVQGEKANSYLFKEDARKVWQGTTSVANIAYSTLVLYLFNPYSIFSCIAFSTGLLSNLLHAFIFLMMVEEYHFMAAVTVGIASYLSFYSLILLVPVLLHAFYVTKRVPRFVSLPMVISVAGVAIAVNAYLSYQSYVFTNSWDFLQATHGFLWHVPDLTPNIGLFWYFFMEMFEHFRSFFLWIFQINAFIYVIPMGVLFRHRPFFLFYVLTSLLAVFKSYPEVSDICIPLALIPIWSYLYRYMRTTFVVVCIFVFTSVLGPVLYYFWIYVGSGNANFFYAVTLVYGLGQILLVSDMVVAYLKREFHLVHGLEPKTEDGDPGVVMLK